MATIFGRRALTLARDITIASGLGASADVTCQTMLEKKSLAVVDYRRTLAVATFSGTYIGGVCTFVYPLWPKLASRVFQKKLSPKGLGVFSSAMDNFVHVPIGYLPVYFIMVGGIQGDSIDKLKESIRNDFGTALVGTWAFWIPFMVFNFGFVPALYQVRAVSTGNYIWTVALDFLTHQAHQKEEVAITSSSTSTQTPPLLTQRRNSSTINTPT